MENISSEEVVKCHLLKFVPGYFVKIVREPLGVQCSVWHWRLFVIMQKADEKEGSAFTVYKGVNVSKIII